MSGLYYYGARYYDNTIGRFITRDPAGPLLSDPQSLNPYVYVENSPIDITDPTGLCPWCITALVGAVAGAAIGYRYGFYCLFNTPGQF